MPRSLLGAAATVVATWWFILTAMSLLSGGSPTPLFHATGIVLLVAAAGGVSVMLCVVLWIYIDRRERRLGLVAQDMRGLISSIGPVPMLLQPPREAPALPRFQAPDVPDDFYVRWLDHFDRVSPRHTALMRRLMRVMQAHRHLPASPVAGGHGDRTLLQHSLLCGYLMHDLARDFKYEGARSKNTDRLVLPLRDPNYRFNAGDPLCVIIGIAHDLGKIESYRYDGDGKVVGIRDEHDLTGARMIARMEECWALPDADRFAMMMALAHYHHPQELPLSPDRKAIDDRTIALMELLTIADVQASAIENTGYRLSPSELTQRFSVVPEEDQLDAGDLFTQFIELLNQPQLINSQETAKCVAWVTIVRGASDTRILVNEGNMAAAIGQALGVDHTKTVGDGRRVLTITLLAELAKRGFLICKMRVQSGEVVEYQPASALWQAKFNRRTAEGHQEPHFGPVVVYVIDPSKLPELRSTKARQGDAILINGLFGSSRRVSAQRQAESPAEGSIATPSVVATATPGHAEDRPPQTAGPEQTKAETPIAAPELASQPTTTAETQAQAGQADPPPWSTSALPGSDVDVVGADPTRAAPGRSTAPQAKHNRGEARRESAERLPPTQNGSSLSAAPAPITSSAGVADTTRHVGAAGSSQQGATAPTKAADKSSSPPTDQAPPAIQPAPQPSGHPTPSASPNGPEVMAAVIRTINGLGAEVAQYAEPTARGHVISLPCEVLASHCPNIAWIEARGHILGLAMRKTIDVKLRPSLGDSYSLEYTVSG